jgi:hypothetical protein
MNNGEYIRKHYMQDNKNMAEYFMCQDCEYNNNCLETVKDMIATNEDCESRYNELLEFLNEESSIFE